jgi:hypothetical protein
MPTALPNDSAVNSVAWNREDTQLIGAGQDGTVHVYAMDVQDLMELARYRVTRDLTQEECGKYLHTHNCPPLPTYLIDELLIVPPLARTLCLPEARSGGRHLLIL